MDIALLGVGRLGEAVLAGLLDSGLPPAQIWATALPAERAAALADRYGIEVGTDNRGAVAEADVVLIAVPPVAVRPLLTAIGPALDPRAVVVSLAAGVPLAALADVWVVDSTPIECGRSRETAKRSDLAGWAEYGYCASHSRYFWGLRLHLVCTLHGLPVAWALTGAKADERETLIDVLAAAPTCGPPARARRSSPTRTTTPRLRVAASRTGLRPAAPCTQRREAPTGRGPIPPLRQVIESINQTFKAVSSSQDTIRLEHPSVNNTK